ncbi:MAG: hypothetical protein V3U45_03755 [bacterium]
MSRALEDVGDAILERSDRNAPVGTTPGPDSLKQSGERIPARASTWVAVVYSSPHAAFVHEGTRPHWPPKGVLVRWIQIKLSKTLEEAKRLDFVVRRKIAGFGTRPNPFLRKAADEVIPFIVSIFERAFADASSRLEQRFRQP